MNSLWDSECSIPTLTYTSILKHGNLNLNLNLGIDKEQLLKKGLLLTCCATIDSDRRFCDDYYGCACSTNVPCMTPNDSQIPVRFWAADESCMHARSEKYISQLIYKYNALLGIKLTFHVANPSTQLHPEYGPNRLWPANRCHWPSNS